MLVDFRLRVISPTIKAHEHNSALFAHEVLTIPNLLFNNQSDFNSRVLDVYMRVDCEKYAQGLGLWKINILNTYSPYFEQWLAQINGCVEFITCAPKSAQQTSLCQINGILYTPSQFAQKIKRGSKIVPREFHELNFFYKIQDVKFWEYVQRDLYEKPEPKPKAQIKHEQTSLF
jgi:hypothetical protein